MAAVINSGTAAGTTGAAVAAATTTSSDAEVAGTTLTSLPVTGATSAVLVGIGVGLIGCGVLAVRFGRLAAGTPAEAIDEG